jgi:hypothetical protein
MNDRLQEMRMSMRVCVVVVAIALSAGACGKKENDIAQVPVGSDVVVTRADGGVVQGKLAARDEQTVKVDAGRVTRTVARDQIADVRVVDRSNPDEPVTLPPIAKFREYTIPAGTKLSLELSSGVDSETSKVEDPVTARLDDEVAIDGTTVLPAGAEVRGVVTEVEPAGKVKGRARLAMRFTRISTGGETYTIAAPFAMTAPSTKKEDAEKIGIPAAGGAVIGAILGGKKGAAIGAAVGGGAGTAHVLLTEGKDVGLASGAVISVALGQPVDVKVSVR